LTLVDRTVRTRLAESDPHGAILHGGERIELRVRSMVLDIAAEVAADAVGGDLSGPHTVLD
jgi:hypothetical protein